MSLAVLANHMASKGRGPDSMLIHMSPREVQGLQALAVKSGGSLTINPETGLPEANFLEKLLPAIIGFGVSYLSGGTISPTMAGFGVGAVEAARTGDLGKGISAGLGAYGGAGLGAGFASAGESVLSGEATTLGANEAGRLAGEEALRYGAEQGLSTEATEALKRQAIDGASNASARIASNASPFDKLSAGAKSVTSSPSALGGFAKDNFKNIAYAAAPILADQAVKSNMPTTTTSPAQMRTYSYDPYGQRYASTGNYQVPRKAAAEEETAAGGGLMGMNNGGYNPGEFNFAQGSEPVVRMADGGVPPAPPTFNSVEDLYTNILGRPSDAGGAEFWKQQFGDTIDPSEINAFTQSANVELANRTPAEQQALAPNLVGYPTRQPSGMPGGFTPMPVMDGGNPLGGQGNAPSFEMGGQGGGVYEQPDGSRYVFKDNQWQNEPAPIPDDFDLSHGGSNGVNPPPYSMGEDGRGLPPDKITYGEAYQGTPDPTNPYISRGNQDLPIAQQSMSAATTGAAPINAGVEELYRSILGRAPDAGGAAYWQQQFGDTVDASERATFAQAAKPEQQVADMYRNVLGRDPDPGGLQYWTTRINAGESPSTVYNEFLASARENTELVTADQIKNATFEQATTPYTGYRSTDQVNIVDEWVRNTLGREPTAADKEQTWYKDAFNAMKTVPEAKNLYGQFIDYAKADAAATTAQKIKDATASLAARGVTEADVLRQTGKTIAQLAASDIDFTKNLVGASQLRAPGTKAGFDFSSIRAATTPKTNAPVGTTNPYGNATNPGDITRNADGSTTVTPNIPGRPYGGFSGMEQVRNAYTDGGGSLGYTSKAPKTMEEFNQLYNKQTGGSKQAYDYLLGKSDYSATPYTSTGEVMKPYAESVLGVPPNIAAKKVLFDPVTRKYKTNPDYVPISYTPEGKRVVGKSDREVKDALTGETATTAATGGLLSLASGGSATDNASYENWLRTNNISIEQVARALGISVAEAKKRYNLKSDSKDTGVSEYSTSGSSDPYVDSNPAWTNLSDSGKAAYYAANPMMANITALGAGALKGMMPGYGLTTGLPIALGYIANMFGGKNPNPQDVPVESRGTALTALNESIVSGRNQDVQNNDLDAIAGSYTYGGGLQGTLGDQLGDYDGQGGGNLTAQQAADAVNSMNESAGALSSNTDTNNTGMSDSDSVNSMNESAAGPSGSTDGGPNGEARGGLNLNGKYYPPKYAQGGIAALAQGGMYNLGDYSDGGRLLRGPGDGVSDSIPATIGKKRPARLADGEFVVPARIVSELGNGSTEAGARKLYAMMDRIQAARRSSIGKGKVAKNSRADKYLPA